MKNKNNIMIITTAIVSLLAVITVVLVTGFMSSASGGESAASVTSTPVVEISMAENPSALSEPESFANSSDNSGDFNSAGDGIGQRIVDMARAFIGSPFAENGATPDGFDNSGFIYYVLRENGYITCPRTTEAQSVMGAKISDYDEMKPGDLIFFGTDDGSEAAFGGIFIGNGKMIACLSTSMDVCEVDVTTLYYTSRFYGAINLS